MRFYHKVHRNTKGMLLNTLKNDATSNVLLCPYEIYMRALYHRIIKIVKEVIMEEAVFFTVEQTAVYLSVPVSQVYTLVKSKDFPVKRIGRHYRIHRESLAKWSTNFTGCQ